MRIPYSFRIGKVFVLTLLFFTNFAFSDVDFVKVEKSERKMYLFEGKTIIKEYQVALGPVPYGHKVQEGDEKTPEGIYTLDYKKEDSSFYRAMHIDYPNEEDKATAESLGVSPGGQIMIHGQPNDIERPVSLVQQFNWTDGCIALTNIEMDEFMELVKEGTKIQIIW